MATDDEDDDDAMTFSDVLCGVSPHRREDNDESSVDIYDGIDNNPTAFDSLATKATPTGNSLNLFDEILIAEGTAKEASYNDLKQEHEKCLQQLQESMKKLQEMQEQNSTLQNENQSLKKNISSLIKTARVEINRKDEEINNLQRRLLGFPIHQNAYSRTYFADPINTRNSVGMKKNNPETDARTTPVIPKDVPHSSPSCDTENQKFHSERRSASYVPRPLPELLHSDANSKLTSVNNSSDKEKGKKEIRNDGHHSKESDYRDKNKGHQNVSSTADGKMQANPETPVRLCKESKNSKLKSGPHSEQRTATVASASEKQPPNDRLPSKTEYSGDDRREKPKDIKLKDLKTQNKDETRSRQKSSPFEKDPEQQKRKSSPPEKIPGAQKLSKSYVEDKKVNDSSSRKNRGTYNHELQKRKLLSPSPPTSGVKHKRSSSKEESSKRECESVHSKSERHRTEEKRKCKRAALGESKNAQTGRTASKELSQRAAKGVDKVKDRTTREQSQPVQPQPTKVAGGLEEQKPTKVRRDEDPKAKSKDLKLSFMQKLNLTLSPAKKQTGESRQPTSGCDGESPSKLASTSAVKQKNPPSEPIPDRSVSANSKPIVSVSEAKGDMGTESLPEILSTDSSRETSDLQNVVPCKPAESLHKARENTGETEETIRLSSVGSPLNQDTLPDSGFNDLETISSVDFDSYSIIDEISGTDSDSLMEVENTANCEDEIVVEHAGKENSLPKFASRDVDEEPKALSRDVPVDNQKPCESNLSCLDHGSASEKLCGKGAKSASPVREVCPVPVDDDNSVLSIDLNHMRGIPKAISPLNSPIRPLAKALRGETTYTGPVKSYDIDLMPESGAVCPARSLSSELNKENQKPFGTDPQVLERESQLSTSSSELEEGEIVSDDDNRNSERNSEYSKKSRGKPSSERSNLVNSPHNQKPKTIYQKPKTISYNEDKEKKAPGKYSNKKPRTVTVRSSKETKKNKAIKTDCLEKIAEIISEPATVHEFMQMLKALRKQVRKNYMKFKVQFPIQHFHRIIDSAISNFTSLVKYLNFSKMSKSNDTLKLNLCEVIESRLKRIKRNSAIDHLFEQQQSDMKKKLWKLVDEQLDSLFDKIKKILLKLCNLINTGHENGSGKSNKRIKESPKRPVGHKMDGQKPKKRSSNVGTQKAEERTLSKPIMDNQLSRRSLHDTNKTDLQKNMVTECTSSHTDNAKRSHPRVDPVREKSVQGTEPALKTGRYEKAGSQLVENSQKSDISCGPLTEQQMSGLTFNLVNDAQMGEMFKSLLQGSDLSEKNDDFMDENQWEFRTPEKQLSGHNCGNDTVYEAEDSFPKETRIESRVLDGIKWPVVSPERDSAFLTRLPMPVDPDILDENCMFDIPSSPALKKSEACILEKPKSLVSSILLEDLAVSLTIPSPLKSDAHLSFLKPDVFGSVPADVVSAHFSEDAHLDEEDASEQDIHLALESDNSSSKSSCSSSWANVPATPGFQYCASLPMQAVIMEKSNDHFIVKIRRAVPSTSPRLGQASLANDSFIERGDDGGVCEGKSDTLNLEGLPLEEIAVPEEQSNVTDSEDKMHDNMAKEHASSSFVMMKELSFCHENNQLFPESQNESNPSAPENTLESAKEVLGNARLDQDCSMPDPLHELPKNKTQHQGTDLIEFHQILHNSPDPEKAPAPPEEVGKSPRSLGSLIEPSNIICHGEDVPDVFKLPQTHSLKVLQKRDVSSATAEQLPVSSTVVPLAFSCEGQFAAIGIDLTNESPMENEVDSWDLIAGSPLNAGTGSLDKVDREPAGLCIANTPLKCDVDEVTDLTAESPDKPTAEENFEQKTSLTTGGLIPGKEGKKRKREIKETSSIKIPRKSSELSSKKNGKSSKKSKESMPVAKNTSSKKAAPVRDKDSSASTSPVPPSSLYAKNIIKKKGEIVISWTRNDDREILLECQKKGASEKTFSSVAAKLNKSSNQVEERFRQLVKLFNMSHCS